MKPKVRRQSPESRLALVANARRRIRLALIDLRYAEANKAADAVVIALKSIDGTRRQMQRQIAKAGARKE